MAVYTYFDGMPGLWAGVRQEGFDRLRDRLAVVRPHRDPVRYLAALGVAYVESALASPSLYRVMFDSTFDLPDPEGAGASFELLVDAAAAAQRTGRLHPGADARDIATRYWSSGHGLLSLAIGGVLPVADLRRHASAVAVALLVAAGDVSERAERSVAAAWRSSSLP